MFNDALTIWSMCPSGFSLLSPTPEMVLPSFSLWEVQGYLQFPQNGSTSSLSQKLHIFPHLCQHTALLFLKVLHCIHIKHYLIKLISSIYIHFYFGVNYPMLWENTTSKVYITHFQKGIGVTITDQKTHKPIATTLLRNKARKQRHQE